jgi:hypothetical protein
MRLRAANGSDMWLAYGMNVHPGGAPADTRRAIETVVLPLRARLGAEGPFGLAVRWSAAGVARLDDDAEAEALRDLLREHDLRVFSGNAFVHGEFHGQPLKDRVYRPPWPAPERIEYTLAFARALAALGEPGAEVSLSTMPLGWKGWGDGADLSACAAALLSVAGALRALHEETGVRVRLGLEPEPGCTLETTDELRAFFAGPLAEAEGAAADRAHLGVCYDVCHQAVEWEDVPDSLGALAADGLPVVKLQASCALELPDPASAGGRDALAQFREPVYLHQVGARDADGVLHVAPDLGAVLDDPAWRARGPWRSHFHVPVFRAEAVPPLRTTQDELREALCIAARGALTPHVEIETYTWDVLPDAERIAGSGFDLVEALAQEYEWVLGVLASAGAHPAGPEGAA